MKRYGIGSFKKAGQVLNDAKKDVNRPKDEVATRRQQKNEGKGGKR